MPAGHFNTDTYPMQAKLANGTSVTIVNYNMGNSTQNIISLDSASTVSLPYTFSGDPSSSNANDTMPIEKPSNIRWDTTADGTSVSYQSGGTTYNINRNSANEFVISPAYTYTVGGTTTTYSNFTTATDLSIALKNINW